MTDLCRTINGKISALKNGTFQNNYTMEHGKIYTSSSVNNEMSHVNNNLWDFLGFKQNMISGENAGTLSLLDRVVLTHFPLGFSSDICIFLYASLVETSGVANGNFSLLPALEQKTSYELVHHYNIKYLQYVPVNFSFLELCQLTLRSE